MYQSLDALPAIAALALIGLIASLGGIVYGAYWLLSHISWVA